MDFGQVVADRISALIEQRGTNNRAVALAAGMSATGVRDIVTRKTKNPTLANLVKIAEALDVSTQEIIGDIPQDRPTVAIAGAVGAGAMVPVLDAYDKSGGPPVECTPP